MKHSQRRFLYYMLKLSTRTMTLLSHPFVLNKVEVSTPNLCFVSDFYFYKFRYSVLDSGAYNR